MRISPQPYQKQKTVVETSTRLTPDRVVTQKRKAKPRSMNEHYFQIAGLRNNRAQTIRVQLYTQVQTNI